MREETADSAGTAAAAAALQCFHTDRLHRQNQSSSEFRCLFLLSLALCLFRVMLSLLISSVENTLLPSLHSVGSNRLVREMKKKEAKRPERDREKERRRSIISLISSALRQQGNKKYLLSHLIIIILSTL
jgi:hypothetical protein